MEEMTKAQRIAALESRVRLLEEVTIDLNEKIKVLREEFDEIDPPVTFEKVAPEPPKSEWRQMVDDYLDEDPGESRAALSYVLSSLSEIAAGENWQQPYSELARIIAVCEQQVGDGWQADPSRVMCDSESGVCDIWCLLAAFRRGYAPGMRWRTLGNRAASWLYRLIQEGS